MDGSAADDLKSLKLLVKELSSKLADSREAEGRLDELINTIAGDAGIDYADFKKRQQAKSREYFRMDTLPKAVVSDTDGRFNSSNGSKLKALDTPSDDNLDKIDKQIMAYQNENIKIEQQIQRNEFLISKYLPLLDREEEILKGLHDFLKDTNQMRFNSEKVVEHRFNNEKTVIEQRIEKQRQTNVQYDEKTEVLTKMWQAIGRELKKDFNKVGEDFKIEE